MAGVKPFGKVAILGGGVLGGSLAMAMRTAGGVARVCLWARREETVAAARALGVEATGDLAAAVAGCELAVLSVPVGAMAGLVADAVAAGLPATAMVTDVGSVKRMPHEALAGMLEGGRFVGSHPMAGSEQTGIGAARADMFEGAMCLVTTDGADPQAVERVEAFWRLLGCRVARMDAAGHDELVARVSHLPHLAAAAVARVALQVEGQGNFGGGGLRDTTRVASGEVAMWAEILLENRDSVVGPVREMIEDLREMLALLEAGREEALRVWLARAKELRDRLRVPENV